jgi:hypothetical protein
MSAATEPRPVTEVVLYPELVIRLRALADVATDRNNSWSSRETAAFRMVGLVDAAIEEAAS